MGFEELSQLGRLRRSTGELRADATARGRDDARAIDRRAHHKDRLADRSRMRGSPRCAAEVHAKVAVAIVVHAVREPVRRIGAQSYDQRDGRDDRDQTIAAKTCSQWTMLNAGAPSVGGTRTGESHPFIREPQRDSPLQHSQKA